MWRCPSFGSDMIQEKTHTKYCSFSKCTRWVVCKSFQIYRRLRVPYLFFLGFLNFMTLPLLKAGQRLLFWQSVCMCNDVSWYGVIATIWLNIIYTTCICFCIYPYVQWISIVCMFVIATSDNSVYSKWFRVCGSSSQSPGYFSKNTCQVNVIDLSLS